MTKTPNPQLDHRSRTVEVSILIGVTLLGAWLRFDRLGDRSLWADEFSTWHVSQLPIEESLRWGPEMSKPPLYQFLLRATTTGPRPSERALRLPAALSGMLLIPAGYVLGRVLSGGRVGLALALLLSCHAANIEYSREARPYSLWVLGITISQVLWFWLNRGPAPRRALLIGYALTTAAAVHSHFLSLQVWVGQGLWMGMSGGGRGGRNHRRSVIASWLSVPMLCGPLVLNYVAGGGSLRQGLNWIPPISWASTWSTLNELGFGGGWTPGVILSGVLVLAVLVGKRLRVGRSGRSIRSGFSGFVSKLRVSLRIRIGASISPDVSPSPSPLPERERVFRQSLESGSGEWMLLLWILCSFGGLVICSLVFQPSMILRYALPASVPLLLFPLMVLARFHGNAPVLLSLLFVVGTAPEWMIRRLVAPPGFREMRDYLIEETNPEKDLIVFTIDHATHPEWEDFERLPWQYYPFPGRSVAELVLAPDGSVQDGRVFLDPRTLYVMVFRADLVPLVEKTGRRISPFLVDGLEYSQRLFEPYRLMRVASVGETGSDD